MNINELVKVAFEDADINGWHDDLPTETGARNQWLGAKILLIVSEAVEAFEEIREGNAVDETYYEFSSNKPSKPCGVPSELADIVIRVADLCGTLKIDLEAIIKEKLEYNRSRGYKHGGKAF